VAHVRLFVGTSLHGVLTAATCGIPALPLSTPGPKLGYNLGFWKIPGLERCVRLEVLCAHAERPTPPSEERIDELRREVWRNFEALVRWL
jgi:hypothetical protein